MRIVFLASKKLDKKIFDLLFHNTMVKLLGMHISFSGDCFAKLSKETYLISFGPTNNSMAFK
jgi:hypothetical protein